MPAEVGKDRHQPPSCDPVLMWPRPLVMCWVGSGEQVKTKGERAWPGLQFNPGRIERKALSIVYRNQQLFLDCLRMCLALY